jgi:flavin-dependent dehydrogenase
VTLRAARWAPCDVAPVVEHVVSIAELYDGTGSARVRRADKPIAYMTQRRRLDQFLVEQAIAAGAHFRDGVGRVAVGVDGGLAVSVKGERWDARVVVGADGANGTTAQALRLGKIQATGVAVEGNLPRASADLSRYDGRGVVQFGIVPGGYGWIFPKGDHANVGIGGWVAEAPRLREQLRLFCERHELPFEALQNIRGHRLPMTAPHATLANDRACLIGDAAGLVDPLTGDGMYECFLSAQLASENVLALLDGRTNNLSAYQDSLAHRLRSQQWASWLVKRSLDRFPRTTYQIVTSGPIWSVIRDLLTGDLHDFRSATGVRRYPLRLLEAAATVAWARARARDHDADDVRPVVFERFAPTVGDRLQDRQRGDRGARVLDACDGFADPVDSQPSALFGAAFGDAVGGEE